MSGMSNKLSGQPRVLRGVVEQESLQYGRREPSAQPAEEPGQRCSVLALLLWTRLVGYDGGQEETAE